VRAIVILLNRVGDIVQATPTLASLKESGYEVHLVVLKQFADICNCIPWIDKLWVAQMDRRWDGLVNDLKPYEFDLLVNLSPSLPAAAISSLVRARERRGLGIGRDGGTSTTDAWTNYYLSVANNKRLNLLNIVDLFQCVAGVRRCPIGEPLLKPSLQGAWSLDELIPRREPYVAIHPGASSFDRQWPQERYVELARCLLAEGLVKQVVVVGSENEKTLTADLQERIGKDCVDLGGKTSIEQLLSVLDFAEIVIGNDSSPVHIASMLCKDTICLSIDPAFYWATGPYGVDSCAIQGTKDAISVKMVLDIARPLLLDDPFEVKGGLPVGVEIAFAMRDRHGFCMYHLLMPIPLTTERVIAFALKEALYQGLLEEGENETTGLDHWGYVTTTSFDVELTAIVTGFSLVRDSLQDSASVCKELLWESRNGGNPDRLRRLQGQLHVRDEGLKLLADQNPMTGLLVRTVLVGKDGIENKDLPTLVDQYRELYSRGAVWADRVKELVAAYK